MDISICTTNYNCAHVLEKHLESVYKVLEGKNFEYIMVDNKSRDGSIEILRKWEESHDNFKLIIKRCTMGEGRQIAYKHSKGEFIVVIDTDEIYFPILRGFIDICTTQYPDQATQAMNCGVFPRRIWEAIGGRRSLNTNEDLDMWMRILKMGKMKWYPVYLGENIKEDFAGGSMDYLSSRYGKFEKIKRLVRREYDRYKTREYQKFDLKKVWTENTIDLGLGKMETFWFESKPKRSILQILRTIGRESHRILKS